MSSSEKQNIKISFSQRSMRFRMRLTKSIVDEHKTFPNEILAQIKSKLESFIKSEQAVEYEIFQDKLLEVWNFFKESSLPASTTTDFAIAQAAPPLKGVALKSSNEPKYVCKLTISPDSPVDQWEPEWLITYINRKMAKAKLKGRINAAQISACLGRAKLGESISGLGLIAEQKAGQLAEGAMPLSISISKARKELYLVINKKEALVGLSYEEVMKTISKAAENLENAIGSNVHIESEGLRAKINLMMNSPAKFGIGLPMAILGGFGSSKIEQPADGDSDNDLFNASGDEAVEQVKRAPDQLYLRVSDDRMSCKVVNFDMQIYQSKKYSCSKEWLVEELERFKIVEEAYEPHIEETLKLMKMEENLNDVVVASGIVGTAAEQPYLFESYKTAKQEAAAESDEKIDFRDLHQTDIVKEETLIAEVRYLIPEEPSINVHGKKAPAPEPEKFKVTVGDGIEERRKGQYWSTDYGVPAIKGNKISLLKVLVHLGDVNMKSGNIIFDGPVEIRGDIDLGATVEATGDIKIIGNVEAATVRSIKGSVIVQGGIITTDRGKVEAKIDVRATFVENSQIIAGEKLIVQKALLNSTVHVGDTVEVIKNGGGMIAGGRINAGKKITTPNLGFQKGHLTTVSCGGDWKTEYSISINANRLEYLKEYLTKNRADLREITGKRKTDKESLELKKIVQDRIKKLRPILDKLESRVNAKKAQLTYYSHAEIFVFDMLYVNCQINISSHAVAVGLEYKEIVITPKKRKGEFIQGIPDYLEFKESQKARLKSSA